MYVSQVLLKYTLNSSHLILASLFLNLAVFAAGEIDPTFNGAAYFQPSGFAYVVARQPDGKILIGGAFEVINGLNRTAIVRVNSDGSVDTSFNAPEIGGDIRSIALQSNGKILIGGNFTIVGAERISLARLNVDGSYDNSFAVQIIPSGSGGTANRVNDIVVLAGDKFLIAGNFIYSQGGGNLRRNIARRNADGTDDNTFNPSSNYLPIDDIEVQPDGKILGAATSGGGRTRFLKRLNNNGTEDPTFNVFVNVTTDWESGFNAVKLQANGRILIGGSFNFVANLSKLNVARLNSDGSLDNTFNAAANGAVYDIEINVDGKIIIAGAIGSTIGTGNRPAVVRFEENGTVDPTFNFVYDPQLPIYVGYDVLPLPDGKIIVAAYKANTVISGGTTVRINANGTLDTTFVVSIGRIGATIADIVPQADGKILVAGNFGAISFAERFKFGRFNADGTVDTTFNPVITPLNAAVNAIAIQPDGKILVGGNIDGEVIRLNPDGSRDTTFNVTISIPLVIFDIAVQPGGKVIAAGNGSIIRFNSDGSLDSTFQTVPAVGTVNKVIVQMDDKILAGGTFTELAGVRNGRIARLNQNGSLDTTFNPPGGANNIVNDIGLQADGKILIGGLFTLVNNVSQAYVARLNADGSTDFTFNSSVNSPVYALVIQADGKIIIGGDFTNVSGISRNKVARLNADGSLDSSFDVGTGANSRVFSLALQNNGKVLLGGNFSTFNNVRKLSIVRLLNDWAGRTRFDFDGDGKADLAVFRPSNGVWYELNIQNNAFYAMQFGLSGDLIAPADYDGDGRTDIAVWRGMVPGAGNQAYFYVFNSSGNSFRPMQFGMTGDVPMSGDWDGDGKADLAVYRNATGTSSQSYFYYRPSSQPEIDRITIPFGNAGDKPLYGDFDGDGRLDAAVFRSSDATWRILQSSNNQVTETTFGVASDIPVPADYDGDGRANIAVFRPSNGYWYTSTNPQINYGAIQFGANGDLPVPADYDGDGKADVAAFRPSNGGWYLKRTTGGFTGVQFGANGDKPIPNAFVR